MKTMRLLLIVFALGAVAAIFIWNYQQRNDPGRIIAAIEAGSAIPVVRLTELGERGKLDAYSDRLGELLASELEADWKPAIAAHAAKNAVTLAPADFSTTAKRTETGLPANDRIQRLAEILFLSNPAKNASPHVLERVARASLHFELASETRVLTDRDIPIGMVVYNATDAWTENLSIGGLSELNEFLRIDRGIHFGLTFEAVHLNGIPSPTRAEMDFGSEMAGKMESIAGFPPSNRHSRYTTYIARTPKTESLNWSEVTEAIVECTITLYRGDDEVVAEWTESISGRVSAKLDLETHTVAFERLLDDALTGDSSSLDRLLAMSAQGELSPFADILGLRLAASLQTHWQPRIAEYAANTAFSPGPIYFEDLESGNFNLLTLFFSSDPLLSATQETWEAVARAATYHHAVLDRHQDQAVIEFRLFSVLNGFQDMAHHQGIQFSVPSVAFEHAGLWEWPIGATITQRLAAASELGSGTPGRNVPTDSWCSQRSQPKRPLCSLGLARVSSRCTSLSKSRCWVPEIAQSSRGRKPKPGMSKIPLLGQIRHSTKPPLIGDDGCVTQTDLPSPTAGPDSEAHPVLPSRWHGVAPAKLVWLTAGLVITAMVALSACSSLIPTRTAPGPDPLIGGQPINPSTVGHESEPLIRVRIVRGESTVTIAGPETVHLLGPSRPRIRAASASSDDDFGASSQTVPTPITVTLGQEAWRITDGRGNSRRMPRAPGGPATDALRITSLSGEMLTLDSKRLPGALWLHGHSGSGDAAGTIDVVEHLPIEVYLPGVIAKELYPNWGLETFKAQAIAARSYAMQERQRRLSIGSFFDLESTTQDQVYGGSTTNPTALRAVDLTYGQVLTWNGHLLRAYYSSTTGGRAASARDTWPTGPGYEFNLMPPIQATARDDIDSFSPLFTWEVERDIEELSARIRAFAQSRRMGMRTITQVARVDPVAFNEFGRPQRYRITEQGGRWWELSAEDTRLAMNHTGDSGLAPPTRDQRINSGDFTTRRDGDKLIFSGRGFGHGVGMSQFGAEGKARQGKTAEAILMHYYPGTELRRAY